MKDRIENNLDEPFFALANFLTVHGPYDPPRPYKEQATTGFSRPRLFLIEYFLKNRGSIDDSDVRLDRVMNAQTADGVGQFLADSGYLNDAEIELLREWYASCVKYLNDELATFLRFYERELKENTILILTADHGEQLGEHNLLEHSHYLFDETLRVPLLMTGLGIPDGVQRTDLASHVDLFDTICDLCEIDPPSSTTGQSLFGGDTRDAVFMEYGVRDPDEFKNNSGQGRYLDNKQLSRFCAGRKAIRTENYLFVLTSNGTEHLYENPEQREIEDAPEGVVKLLRERLNDALPKDFGMWPEGEPDDGGLDPQVEQNLRELGYIE